MSIASIPLNPALYRRCRHALLITAVLTQLAACTTQAWYDGLRQSQRDQCQLSPTADERQACLERNKAPNYDRYEKERNGPR